MAIYNSASAREIAVAMQATDGILEESLDQYRGTLLQAEELSGNAAEAMEEELHRLIRAAQRLETEMNDMGRMMHRYADTLEALDEQLAGEY